MTYFLLKLIRFYQFALSPLLGRSCRFWPSCSTYGLQAIQTHGPGRGTLLTLWRIARCAPWCQGGVDPVPTDGRLPRYGCLCTIRNPLRRSFPCNVLTKKDKHSS
ncbi:MAG: membrane protein insertion efficiency factor YidD [Burkholderiaceae bacterium]|nr:membrane protein insertion efficiency factor YidD [Burkholderiaceae bacterium]